MPKVFRGRGATLYPKRDTSTEVGDAQNTEEVRSLQEQLRDLGHRPGRIDGKFGEQTKKALTGFQGARGLSADGLYGPQTRQALTDALTETGERLIKSGLDVAGAGTAEDRDGPTSDVTLGQVLEWPLTIALRQALDGARNHGWESLTLADLVRGLANSDYPTETSNASDPFARWLLDRAGEKRVRGIFVGNRP
jgi:hypothetical protein